MISRMKLVLTTIVVLAISYSCKENVKPLPQFVNSSNFMDSFTVVNTAIAYKLDTYFKARHLQSGFNGSVIIAKGGKIYYKGNFGLGNKQLNDSISERTSFQIASISKTFTATAILYLVEKGKLSLNNKIEDFITDFPYKNRTIQSLLCHRSGLPNYLHFGEKLWTDKSKYMSNEDLINIMKKNPAIEGTYAPNTRFQYCNTNYALLASIIEKVTGKSYPDFMQSEFFTPFNMQNSWIYDPLHSAPKAHAISYNSKWVIQNDDSYDGVYGDKGVFASSEDMLRWDMQFYENKAISTAMQTEAYKPRSFEKKGFRNYGYGWRLLKQPNDQYLVYHNGWWHGNNTVFYRYIPDTFSLIILSNKYNRGVYNVQPIFNILSGTNNNAEFGEE